MYLGPAVPASENLGEHGGKRQKIHTWLDCFIRFVPPGEKG